MIREALKFAMKRATTEYEHSEFRLNEKRYIETLELITNQIPETSKILENWLHPRGIYFSIIAT